MKDGRGRNYFVKILLNVTLLTLVPVALITMYFYTVTTNNILHSLEEQTLREHKTIFRFIRSNIERMSWENLSISQIEKVSRFLDFNNGYALERMRGPIPEGDLNAMYYYVLAKQELVVELARTKSRNSLVDSIYFYDRDKELVLNDLGQSYEQGELAQDPFWEQVFSGEPVSLQRVVKNGDPLLALCYSIYGKGVLVLYMDEEAMYDSLYSLSYMESDNLAFAVASEDWESLYCNGTTAMREAAYDYLRSPAGEAGDGWSGLYGGQVFVSSSFFSPTATHFLTVVDFSGMKESYLGFLRVTLLLTGLAAVALAAVSYLISRRLYRPISSLAQDLSGSGLTSRDRVYSDFSSIAERYSALNLRYAEILPVYRERFFRQLLRGAIPADTPWNPQQLHFLRRLRIPYELLLVRIVNCPGSMIEANIRMREALLSELEKQGGEYVELDSDLTAMICPSSDPEGPVSRIRERLSGLSEELRLTLRWSESGEYSEVDGIQTAYGEALSRLDGEAPETRPDAPSADYVPLLQELERSLLNMQPEDALGLFDRMVRLLEPEGGGDAFRTALRKCYDTVTAACERLGIRPEELLPEIRTFSSVLDGNGTAPARELLRGFLRQLSQVFCIKGDQKLIVGNAIQFIESGNPHTLSLESAADHLGISSGYLSRIFKAVTGNNFGDYIILHKVNEAKKLLVSTKLTVAQISEAVGYSQCNYFIKVFKYVTGTTPGRYRRINQQAQECMT